MVDNLDFDMIEKIFSIFASTAAIILLIFTLLQLKIMNKDRETDLTIRIFDRFRDPIFVSSIDWMSENIKDRSFDKIDILSEEGKKIRKVAVVFEEIGTLLKMKSIRKDLILSLISTATIISTWDELEKFIKKERERQKDNTLWVNFEYLKDEAEKFEEKIKS